MLEVLRNHAFEMICKDYMAETFYSFIFVFDLKHLQGAMSRVMLFLLWKSNIICELTYCEVCVANDMLF